MKSKYQALKQKINGFIFTCFFMYLIALREVEQMLENFKK